MPTKRAYLFVGALTLLTVGPSSASVYRYPNVVSRQLSFLSTVSQSPRRGAEHLSLCVFSPVQTASREIFSKRDVWGTDPDAQIGHRPHARHRIEENRKRVGPHVVQHNS